MGTATHNNVAQRKFCKLITQLEYNIGFPSCAHSLGIHYVHCKFGRLKKSLKIHMKKQVEYAFKLECTI